MNAHEMAKPAPARREGTFREPVTPEMVAALRGAGLRQRWAIIGGTALVCAAVTGWSLTAGRPNWGAVVVVLLIGAAVVAASEYKRRGDLEGVAALGVCNHYVGHVEIKRQVTDDEDDDGTVTRREDYWLVVREAKIPLAVETGRALGGLRWAEVWYLDTGGIGGTGTLLLDVHDADGRVLHRHPDYHPT